jgi:hypothetical protein
MKGHNTIIASRLCRNKPPFVFVNDYPCKTDWFETGEQATVCTHADNLANNDFRFLVGCSVSISANTEPRAKELFKRIKDAGATTVAACHIQPSQHATEQPGWCEVWRAAS